MATKRSRTYGEFDAATMRQAMAAPGMDPRQWVSMATVDVDEGSQRAVRYDIPDYGHCVHCTLQPSGIPVVARIASRGAGSGEADIEPFAAGDEVIVLIPEGDERAGPVIVGRLNNKLSPAPTRIAGTDIQNNVSGIRRMGPYFVESNTAITLRVSSTEAYLALSQDGNTTLTSGDKSFLHLGADFIGMQTGDGAMVLQADQNAKEWHMLANTDQQTSYFRVGGNQPGFFSSERIYLSTNGQQPWMHLVTFEQVINIVATAFGAMTCASPGAPLLPVAPSPVLTAPFLTAFISSILPGMSSLDFAVPGSHFTLAALAAGSSKQTNATGTTGLATGIIAS